MANKKSGGDDDSREGTMLDTTRKTPHTGNKSGKVDGGSNYKKNPADKTPSKHKKPATKKTVDRSAKYSDDSTSKSVPKEPHRTTKAKED